MVGLLGLTRGFSGGHFKSPPQEPSVMEINPSPRVVTSDPLDDDLPSRNATPLSPTLFAANSVMVTKRPNSRMTSSMMRYSNRSNHTFLQEQQLIIRHRLQQQMGGIGQYAFDTSHEGLLKYIRTERMMRLPAKGGSWDRVLIAAHYFADQVERFSREISDFAASDDGATNLVFGQCMVLLELGHKNAAALETAFNAFYQFGLELAPLLHRAELFKRSNDLMLEIERAFVDLLQIVTGISISFYQAVHGGRSFTKIDIFTAFSSLIEAFRHRVHVCSHTMWNMTLDNKGYEGCQVEELQEWLAPRDSVLAFLASNHIRLGKRADPFTCTWFQSDLTSFLKNKEKVLLVEGKSGSGKTMLANWTSDRLQRPIARSHVSTINFSFDYSIATQSRPLDMLKTLLNQLLLLRIGDLEIFQAVLEAYNAAEKANTAEKLEASLWTALSKCIKDVSDEEDTILVLIIDNISENVRDTAKKLQDIVVKCSQARLILFSQQYSHGLTSIKKILITDKNTEDIRTLFNGRLQNHDHFQHRQAAEREEMIEQLTKAADGNMLWTSLTCKFLQRQNTIKSFDAALDFVHKSSKTVEEAVSKLLYDLELTDDCEKLLAMIGTAQRPLKTAEIEAFMRIEKSTDNDSGTASMLNSIRAFTTFSEGLVAISHNAVKRAIFEFKSDRTLTKALNSREHDMVVRLLGYIKLHLVGSSDPTMTALDLHQTRNRLRSSVLLEYAIRYWIVHFRKSQPDKIPDAITLTKEIKQVFPNSVLLVILEQSCWSHQFFADETYSSLDLAYRVRRAQFGAKHNAVLQSALFLALFSERTLTRENKALEWYHIAAHLARDLIGVQADITISCCTILLRLSKGMLSKETRSIFRYREEVLLILVASYEHRYGSASKQILEIYYMLRDLYEYYEEKSKLEAIIIKIDILIGTDDVHSRGSIGTVHNRKAEVILKPKQPERPIEVIDDILFGDYREEVREVITIEIIQKEWKALLELTIKWQIEERLIALWLKLSDHCQHVHDCIWHEWKIRVMLKYAEFLHVEKRYTEASAILIAVWTEYEHHQYLAIESIIVHIRHIAVLLKKIAIALKTVSLLTVALSMFKQCLFFFRQHRMEKSEHFVSIEIEITEISVVLIKETESSTSVIIIREIFESYFESTETVITTQIVEICRSLATTYISRSEYSEAITIIKKLITKSWVSFFSESIESTVFTELFLSQNIELLIKLVQCYESTRRIEKAEEIYLRLYLVYFRRTDNTKLIEYYRHELIRFYEKHGLFVKLISFYQELLVEYRKISLISTDTIRILYILGDLCRKHSSKYGYWLEYYLEIIINLNQGLKYCHKDAFRALVIIAEHYYEELRYSESIIHFKMIFETFFLYGNKYEHYEYFRDIKNVRLLIKHYFHCIEESKISIDIHIDILVKLREACLTYFSSELSLYVEVSIMLAESYERHSTEYFKAIEVYEFLLEHHKTIMVTTTITKITKSLHVLYVKQVLHEEKTVTKETLQKSITIIRRRYLEIRKEHTSYTHQETIAVLKQLIMLYYKLSKFELKQVDIALAELKLHIVEIVKTAVSVKEMLEAASMIASIYISCEWIEQGLTIIQELKRQIIYKLIDQRFEFNVIGRDRSCFTFIAAFEYHLRFMKFTIAYYIRDLVAEFLFYERFVKHTESKNFELLLVCASRLRQLLVRTGRVKDFGLIEIKVIEFVKRTETRMVKHSKEASIAVFVSVVLEYYATSHLWKSWTAGAAFAAVKRIESMLVDGKHEQALQLTTCTFHFLMAHEGLDDSTELTLGFKLALMMAGRTVKDFKTGPKKVVDEMMALSRQILAEVFDICDSLPDFNLARCQLLELNELIILLGEQRDYGRLVKLLNQLWTSRNQQTTWPAEVPVYLGKRLIQALFANNKTGEAIQLCEAIAYNIRRVNGARHHQTLSFQALLATMYTTVGQNYAKQAADEKTKNKKHAADMRQLYFKKAVRVHEEGLRLIVNSEDPYASDGDDDDDNNYAHETNGQLSAIFVWLSRTQELNHVKIHVRRLQLALQRLGGPLDEKHKKSLDDLMKKVWELYHIDSNFKMGKDQVFVSNWKLDGFGGGKAEGEMSEDGYMEPRVWWVVRRDEPEGA